MDVMEEGDICPGHLKFKLIKREKMMTTRLCRCHGCEAALQQRQMTILHPLQRILCRCLQVAFQIERGTSGLLPLGTSYVVLPEIEIDYHNSVLIFK